MTQEALNEALNSGRPQSERSALFEGQTIRLDDGRRVSLEWLLWDARRQQSREAGRLCGVLARRVWRALAALFGPPLGWQRRALPRQRLAGSAGASTAAVASKRV